LTRIFARVCQSLLSFATKHSLWIPSFPVTAKVADDWKAKAFTAFEAAGIAPRRVVAIIPEAATPPGEFDAPLDITEYSVRNKQVPFGQMIIKAAMQHFKPNGIDVAWINGGSLRADDEFLAGPVTAYDIIRISPFAGAALRLRK
jgi:5'-nucleotidase